jgi:integrase
MSTARQGRVYKDGKFTSGPNRGRDRWNYVVDVAAGGQPRKQQRRRGFASKGAAVDAMNKASRSAADGERVDRSTLTVSECVTRYIEHRLAIGAIRPTTAAGYRHVLAKRIDATIGALRVQALRATHLDDLYASLRTSGRDNGTGLSAGSVGLVHALISGALRWAVKKNLVARNEATRADPPAADATETPTWTADEVESFLAQVRDDPDYPLWMMLARSGLRRGEACALTWEAVDLDAGFLDVRASLACVDGVLVMGEPKTRRSRRRVPIGPETVDVLREHRRAQRERWIALGVRPQCDLVFPDVDGRPRKPISVTRRFGELVAKSELPRVTLHSLRHARETFLWDAGLPPHVIAAVQGHKASEGLDTYAHTDDASLAVVRSLEERGDARREVL